MKTRGDDPAFPELEFYDNQPTGVDHGLTKREAMAKDVMGHLMASDRAINASGNTGDFILPATFCASIAVAAADALIKALNDER